jgi:hypothetical protein
LARRSLPGFQRSPLHRHSCRASTPGWPNSESTTVLRFGAATFRTRSVLAVPPSFDGLRRIDSLRVCCTPQPVMGSAMFPAPRTSSCKHESVPRHLSRWRHTLRSFSLDCSCAASPRSVPSRRSVPLRLPGSVRCRTG